MSDLTGPESNLGPPAPKAMSIITTLISATHAFAQNPKRMQLNIFHSIIKIRILIQIIKPVLHENLRAPNGSFSSTIQMFY